MNANFRNKVLIGTSALTLTFGLAIATSALGWFTSGNTIDPSVSAASKNAYFAGGKGTSDEPYQISSATHFYNLCWLQYLGKFNQPASKGQTAVKQTYFVLNNDIDLSKISDTDSRTLTLPPIGTTDNPFVGNFDGKSFTIKNAHVISGGSSSSDVDTDYPIHPYAVKNGASGINISGLFGVVGSLSEATSSASTSAAVTYKDVASGATSTTSMTYNPSINAIKNVKIAGIEVENKLEQNLSGLAIGFMNGTASGISLTDSGTVSSSVVFDSTAPQAYSTGSLSVLTNRTALSDYSLVGTATASYVTSVSRDTTTIMTPETSSSDFTAASGTLSDWGGSINFTTVFDNMMEMKSASEKTLNRRTDDVTPSSATTTLAKNADNNYSNFDEADYSYGMVTMPTGVSTVDGTTTTTNKAVRFLYPGGKTEHYLPYTKLSAKKGSTTKQCSSFQFVHDRTYNSSICVGGDNFNVDVQYVDTKTQNSTTTTATTDGSFQGQYISFNDGTDDHYLAYSDSTSVTDTTTSSEASPWWFGYTDTSTSKSGCVFTEYTTDGETPVTTRYFLNCDTSGNLSLNTTPSTSWSTEISGTTLSLTCDDLFLTYSSGWKAINKCYKTSYTVKSRSNSIYFSTSGTSLSSTSDSSSASYYYKMTASDGVEYLKPVSGSGEALNTNISFGNYSTSGTYSIHSYDGTNFYLYARSDEDWSSTAYPNAAKTFSPKTENFLYWNGNNWANSYKTANDATGNFSGADSSLLSFYSSQSVSDLTCGDTSSTQTYDYSRQTISTSSSTTSYTVQSEPTYFPINNNNSEYKVTDSQTGKVTKYESSEPFGIPGTRNTGYMTSGSHLSGDPASDLRFKAFYKNGASSGASIAMKDPYTPGTETTPGSLTKVYTIKSTDDSQTVQQIGTDIQPFAFKKYKSSLAKFQKTLYHTYRLDYGGGSSNDYCIDGFHFMSGAGTFGQHTVTIPDAYMNTSEDDSANWRTNFKIPSPSLDFYLKGQGYVNFFSLTQYNKNNFFFDVNQVFRGDSSDSNKYLGVKKISKIYSDGISGHSFVYQYFKSDGTTDDSLYSIPYSSKVVKNTDGTFATVRKKIDTSTGLVTSTDYDTITDRNNPYNTTGHVTSLPTGYSSTPVFNTKCLCNLPTSIQSGTYFNRFFYMEIPLSDGEFALSPASTGGRGIYVFYLDIGSNADEIQRSSVIEEYLENTSSYQYPIGVAMISSSGTSNAEKDCAYFEIPTGSTGTVKISKSSDTALAVETSLALKTKYQNPDPAFTISVTGGGSVTNAPSATATVTTITTTTYDYYVIEDCWVKTVMVKTIQADGTTTQTAKIYYIKTWNDDATQWTEETSGSETHFYYIGEDDPYAYDLTDLNNSSTNQTTFVVAYDAASGSVLIKYSFDDDPTSMATDKNTKTIQVTIPASTDTNYPYVIINGYTIAVTKTDGTAITVEIITPAGTVLTVTINGDAHSSSGTIVIPKP